ncbi:MAG: AmmeMemoRadiSam system protein B [Candidatus Aminicenantes bacterium]|nr:AmmeMemoRadiSam system protein B [Candidatus Aminicenantes bacterium]
MKVRKRVLPPGWYPGTARECEREIKNMIVGFSPPPGRWTAGVAPHAGWFFSGRPAAKAVSGLAASNPSAQAVVVFGGHLPEGERPIVYGEDAWETPFGNLDMDADLALDLTGKADAVRAPASFADNTVEIQLPLVKWFFPKAVLIAAHTPASLEAQTFASALWDLLQERGRSAVFLGSADLTHYGPDYGFAPKGTGSDAVKWVKEVNDKSLVDKVLSMDAAEVLEDARIRHNTCSAGPIVSAMTCAARGGVQRGVLLEYATSHDIRPASSFVGYAAILF